MHLLVLQHARIEHPGIFQKFLKEDGHSWEVVHLDEGQDIPSIDSFDGIPEKYPASNGMVLK